MSAELLHQVNAYERAKNGLHNPCSQGKRFVVRRTRGERAGVARNVPRESSPPLSYFGLRKLQLSVGVDIRPLFDATGSRLFRHAAVEPFKSIVAASSSSIRSRSPVAAQAMRFFAI